MNLLILLPSRVPPVVSSVGLLRIYADGVLPDYRQCRGSLIGTWFTVVLPSCTGRCATACKGVPLKDLMDAAICWGQQSARAFLLVVIPPAQGAAGSAVSLPLASCSARFVFANMLVGTRYETLQVYLANMRATSRANSPAPWVMAATSC